MANDCLPPPLRCTRSTRRASCSASSPSFGLTCPSPLSSTTPSSSCTADYRGISPPTIFFHSPPPHPYGQPTSAGPVLSGIRRWVGAYVHSFFISSTLSLVKHRNDKNGEGEGGVMPEPGNKFCVFKKKRFLSPTPIFF